MSMDSIVLITLRRDVGSLAKYSSRSVVMLRAWLGFLGFLGINRGCYQGVAGFDITTERDEYFAEARYHGGA